ncbi:hypothetical protein BC834DRAFT_797740, partial [Gloeopeniophorella convolvens]
AIGDRPCRGDIRYLGGIMKPCGECTVVKHSSAFSKALGKEGPQVPENRKYTPHIFQAAATGKMYAAGYGDLIEGTSTFHETLRRFTQKAAAGKFDDKPVFIGLIQAAVDTFDRQERGRGLQNMKYMPEYDKFTQNLFFVRPSAYRAFRLELPARTERSIQLIQATAPRFQQGLTPQALERAVQYLQDYQYPLDAPLAIGVDDTKLEQSIEPYYDSSRQKWFMVGGTGEPLEVSDISALEAEILEAREHMAQKLRLWTLQILLPHVPPLILAVMPIASTTSAADVAAMDRRLLDILLTGDTKLRIVSLGSDGSAVERQARRILVQSGYAEAVHYTIPIPDSDDSLTITFIKVHGFVIAIIQDPKHYRKTARNNLFSGARVLVLGDHAAFYELVRTLAQDLASPLYWRDVDKLDRQDDRAAARLFSAAFLRLSIEKGNGNHALPIYAFVLGDLVDAFENRHISHAERINMVLRAKFFKDKWKQFLKESGYSEARYFISAAADDIMDVLINGYMSLVYIYRDHLGRAYPLLPWLHGSEANEHVFGMMRSIITDFTMLHVLQMIPKITVRLLVACRAKNKIDYKRTASGYCHTYFDANDVPLQDLARIPSDDEI